MSDLLKISGKKIPLTQEEEYSPWTLQARPGGWLIAERTTQGSGEGSEGKSIERRRFSLLEDHGELSFSLGGFLYHGKIEVQQRGASSQASEADLTAQFPGKVRKVLVQVGEKVKEGTPLVLLEAMKMEFSIKAPFDGVVQKINVQEEQQLTPGQKLVDLQPESKQGKKV